MPELRPSDQNEPGIARRRRGRGFSYHKPDGGAVRDAGTLSRIRAPAIPPAWTDVWICASPDGHLQAVGTDAAARLLDVGFFRVGGESYDSYGLATLKMEHVSCGKGVITCSYPAKDFRTWHATVLAAVGLAVSIHAGTGKRAVTRVMKEAAEYLGNTPRSLASPTSTRG
ncbi:hypothetical protein [Nonomuraea sp. NPDC049158]|uniref:hypothetical protein n=1 Tax=Nonomuraea sp. NPDC049158 TaxID=3155649 RepID=UPI0033F1060C